MAKLTLAADLTHRFPDFLASPRELLDFEIKQWLDLKNENHRGLLAKAMIAMENHGGGYVLIGYKEGNPPIPAEEGRPNDLAIYSSDTLGSILRRYAEPVFNVDIVHVQHPENGGMFPVVIVPGTAAVPVRSKSQSPNGKTITINTYYIRRPGPAGEPIQTAHE
jgi:hypothetical protein